MSVHWSKPNDFVPCAGCGNNECKIRSERKTAGCAFGKKSDKPAGK